MRSIASCQLRHLDAEVARCLDRIGGVLGPLLHVAPGNGAGLEFFVRVTQWTAIDKNDNGLICMKDWPNTPGTPAYFFGGVDDQAAVRA